MAPTFTTEQVYSSRDRAGVAVSPFSNIPTLADRIPVFPPLGTRCLLFALVGLRLGRVLYPWSRYRSTRPLDLAYLVAWISSINSSDVFNTQSPRQNHLRSHSNRKVSLIATPVQPYSSYWGPPQHCMADRKSYIFRHDVQGANDSQTNR